MSVAPLVSVVMPVRNEAAHIVEAVGAMLASDYPRERLEVLVVDGASQDATRELVLGIAARDARVRLLDNPGGTTPVALNIGVRAARGDVIMLMGGHTRCAPDYVRLAVESLQRSGADAVGGVCLTVPAGPGPVARGIALALQSPVGIGNSWFRLGTSEPRWVDTVPFGCFPRRVFEEHGLFDEVLLRNQDDEYNMRIVRRGARLLLDPRLATEYVARRTLGQLATMFFQYGRYKPLVIRKVGRVMTARQLAPITLVAVLAASVLLGASGVVAWPLVPLPAAAYGALLLAGAARACPARERGVLLATAGAMATMHLSYGLGFARGLVEFVVLRRDTWAPPADLGLSR